MIGKYVNTKGNATGGGIVKDYYEEDIFRDAGEINLTKVTVRMSLEAACMFNAVSSRFRKTRFDLLQSHFDVLATQMFDALDDKDKEEISKIVDLEFNESLKKTGASIKDSSGNDTTPWANYLSFLKSEFESEYEHAKAKDEKC